MEFKQLEYFIAAADSGSLNRAASQLYTSQPNVSKVIANLENELGVSLFERTSKGIRLTSSGGKVYDYARNILDNVNVMMEVAAKPEVQRISVSCYPSNMMARLMTDFYLQNQENNIHIEFRERNIEEITEDVANFTSELGIVYVAKKQMKTYKHVLGQKKLEFYALSENEICLYVGKNHPFYNRNSVGFEELCNLKFVQGSKDYFSMEYNLHKISEGAVQTDKLNHVVHTNSDHMLMGMLLNTDVCSLGIDILYPDYQQSDIKVLKINHCNKCLAFGYVVSRQNELSIGGKAFLKALENMIK